MTEHVCKWRPVYGVCARYSCACGAVGHRWGDGQIRPARASSPAPWAEDLITAQPIGDANGRVLPHIPEELEMRAPEVWAHEELDEVFPWEFA